MSPEYSLEGSMLKLQSFGHLMGRTNSLEKTLMLGKNEGGRRTGWQRMKWLDGITDWTDIRSQTELNWTKETFSQAGSVGSFGISESSITEKKKNHRICIEKLPVKKWLTCLHPLIASGDWVWRHGIYSRTLGKGQELNALRTLWGD